MHVPGGELVARILATAPLAREKAWINEPRAYLTEVVTRIDLPRMKGTSMKGSENDRVTLAHKCNPRQDRNAPEINKG